MKVPPKRKGNISPFRLAYSVSTLNESPSEKEGKCGNRVSLNLSGCPALNESPSEKEGKFLNHRISRGN